MARELPSQKTINFDYFRLLKSDDLSKVEILKNRGGSGHEMFMDSVRACDFLFPLPVEEKAVSGLPEYARDCLFPLPVEENST